MASEYHSPELLVPGTVLLTDENSINKAIILVPAPSQHDRDPLRWSRGRKRYAFCVLTLWEVILAAAVNWTGPPWEFIMETTGADTMQMNIGIAILYIFLAFGIFANPLANWIGRRPVYLVSTFLQGMAGIICAKMTSVSGYYAYNWLSGMAASPGDTLVEVSIADMFFVHERGTYLSIYLAALYAGSFAGPIVSGYVTLNSNMGWQWNGWLILILGLSLCLLMGFTLEESLFRRQPQLETTEGEVIIGDDEKKGGDTLTRVTTSDKVQFYEVAPKPPYRQRMALWTVEGTFREFCAGVVQPLLLIGFPLVVYSGIVYGLTVSWLTLLIDTQAAILQSPPYNLSVGTTGLTNLAPLIGSILGTFDGGMLSDWFFVKMAHRNKGISEPEHRLWLMFPAAFILSGGILMYGLAGTQFFHGSLWMNIIGQGFMGFGMVSTGAISLAYVIDCYKNIASTVIVLVLVIRNWFAAGFTFTFTPWYDHSGLQNMTIQMAMLALGLNCSAIVVIIFGKSLRKMTAKRYMHMSRAFGELH